MLVSAQSPVAAACKFAGATSFSLRSAPKGRCGATAAGFSLLELLVVLSIVILLAAIALPNLNSFRPNVGATAGRQLLADVNHARQLAISLHATVYMVFVPTNVVYDPLGSPLGNDRYGNSQTLWNEFSLASPLEGAKGTNILEKQLTGYNYVVLRSLGDQPGNWIPRYLGSWKTLPEGAYIHPAKFVNPSVPNPFSFLTTTNLNNFNSLTNYYSGSTTPYLNLQHLAPFATTNIIPFPSEYNTNGPYITLPYIAFNYLGQLVNGEGQNPRGSNEFIPLVKGAVLYSSDSSGKPMLGSPSVFERPAGNSTNAYNVVEIDWLTGRARLQTPPLQ